MKNIVTICIILALFSLTAFGQTAQWQYNGIYHPIPGPDGSVYLTQSNPGLLEKVNANGSTVVWSVSFSPITFPNGVNILPARDGFFVVGFCSPNLYEIKYVNAAGAVMWLKAVPGYGDEVSVDSIGNLYVVDTHSSPQSIAKYNISGNKIFAYGLPTIPNLQGIWASGYIGVPYFGLDGKIWLVAKVGNSKHVVKSGVTTDEERQYAYITVIDQTGQPAKPSSVKKPWIKVSDFQDYFEKVDAKGNSTLISVGMTGNFFFGQLQPYGMVNGTLVLWWDFLGIETDITKGSNSSTSLLNEGRIITINSKGGVKLFKFKGKGVNGSGLNKHDVGNSINSVSASNGDILYVVGSQSIGKPPVETGTLMKFNVAKGKPVWTLPLADPYSARGYAIGNAADQIMVYSGNTGVIYNADGTQVQLLTLAGVDWVRNLLVDNNSNLYVNCMNGLSSYFIKYTLPISLFPKTLPKGISELPTEWALRQNYPNPFNPTTTISFALPEQAGVTLKIYNLLGQEVAAILNGEQMNPGEHHVEFNGANLSSGSYTYRIEAVGNDDKAKTFTQVKRMMLVK